MIITISGNLGSGKSTIAKIVAKKLGLKHYSAGDFMRAMAAREGLTLLELSKNAEGTDKIDQEIDARTKELGESEDDFIIDSRLAFHFIPKSFKIFLKASYNVAAERIFKNKRAEEKENTTLEKTKENIKKREESEYKRYKEIYGLTYGDEKNYDFILDTDNLNIEQVTEKVLKAIEKNKK